MKRLYLWGLLAVAVVAVGGALLYGQRPTRVAEAAITTLSEARTARFAATLQLENAQATQQQLGELGTVEITLDGVFERRDNEPDAIAADVAFATKTESISVTVDGEVRFVGDKAYVNIEKTPPTFAALNQLKGQWLFFERGAGPEAPTANETAASFVSVKRKGTSEVNGEPVVLYEAVATDEAVIAMMDGIAELLGTRLTQDQITDLRNSVTKVGQVPVELKVRRWSNELRQLSTVLEVPGGNTVRFTLTPKELNTPVEITEPDGAVSLNEAVAALQQQAAPVPPAPTSSPAP
jgi:hypothetical protein